MLIAQQLVNKLIQGGYSLATAESCTGGLIAAAVVDVPGASQVFAGGAVTYMESKKTAVLGVSPLTLKQYSAVSPQTAEEMCRGAARLYNTRVAVSATGYAGPDGGTPADPVGTVYIGIYIDGKVTLERLSLQGDRNTIRNKATEGAINCLLSHL